MTPSSFEEFVGQECEPDMGSRLAFQPLYTAYLRWCADRGYPAPATTVAAGRALGRMGFPRAPAYSPEARRIIRWRLGIRFRPGSPYAAAEEVRPYTYTLRDGRYVREAR